MELEIPRRSSLRRSSMSKKDESFGVKFPPINQKSNLSEIQTTNPASIISSPRNSLASSRRNSLYRRLSTSQNSDQIPLHSVTFGNKSESEVFRDSVPLSNLPRFSCDLSLEGRYAVFKGYEKILIKKLEKKFPEYVNIINKTSNTVSNSINNVVLNKEIIQHKTVQYEKEFQLISHPKETKKKTGKNRTNTTDSMSNNQEEYDLQLKAKLLMGRYLQFAHVILDILKPNEFVRSSKNVGKLQQKNFNPIKSCNWWNSAWQECFIQKHQPSKLLN